MNYISEIKAFFDLMQSKQLSTGQIALWHSLMHMNNICAWTEWFTAPSITLQLFTGLSRRGIIDARSALKQAGLIDFRANGTKATKYKMLTIAKFAQATAQGTAQETAQATAQGTAQETATLNKRNKTKTKQRDITPTPFDAAEEPLKSALLKFRSMRKAMKEPFTEHAETLTLTELEKLAPGDISHQVRILEQSIQRGWKGIFALKQETASMGRYDNLKRLREELG